MKPSRLFGKAARKPWKNPGLGIRGNRKALCGKVRVIVKDGILQSKELVK